MKDLIDAAALAAVLAILCSVLGFAIAEVLR